MTATAPGTATFSERPAPAVNRKRLLGPLAGLFAVILGVGITLPVLPFSVERLTLQEAGRARPWPCTSDSSQ